MFKVLVTGGAGYIGSHTLRFLERAGNEVVVYDNFSRGHREAVKNYMLVESDTADRKLLLETLARYEIGEDHDPETHLVPLVIDAALGRGKGLVVNGDDYPTPDGTPLRDYIHVDDLAAAHVLALEAMLKGRCSGRSLTTWAAERVIRCSK